MADEKNFEEEFKDENESEELEESQESQEDQENKSMADDEKVVDEIEDLKNSLLRLQADFANYRNRSSREKLETIKTATSKLIEEILPVLDNFERAFAAAEAQGVDEGMLEGFKLIQKELLGILQAQGLEEIQADGQPFDPNFHEAILVEPSDKESGIILETLQKGYKLNDKVIRASVVKVSE